MRASVQRGPNTESRDSLGRRAMPEELALAMNGLGEIIGP